MKFIVLLHTAEHRGDHAADVCSVHDIADGETVEALANRLLKDTEADNYSVPSRRYEWIEIRPVVKA